MTQITTSGGMITFQDTVTGLTKQIGQNQLWLKIKADTVNFLQVSVPTDGYDGTPFWSCRAENLEINGETYTIEELRNGEGLSELFSTMGWGYEIVEELPDVGDAGVIYLVYDDETGTYTEYLWLAQEQTWEELGSVGDIDLSNYYSKTEIDTMLQGYAETSDLATVATSGSYDDLTDKPTIPAAQVQANWGESDSSSMAYIQNKPTIPTVDQTLIENSTNAAQSGATYTALAGKQPTLISGTTIKTINNESILGAGNINISGGSAQVQSNWNETNTESMAYIQNKPTIPAAQVNSDWNASSGVAQILNKPSLATVATTGAYSDLSGTPTNVSSFTNDAGYLTSHQSLADVFADVLYDSQTKHINFYGKGDTQHTTVLAYVDATDFVVDGMVSNVEIKSVTISGTPTTCLVITFNSDAGKQDINIPISQIFDASNYYTKSEVDTALSGKASTSSLATVATSGPYNALTNKPTIPAAQVNSDWNASSGVAQILNKPTLATVATSGSYNDLSDKPVIPTGVTVDQTLDTSSTNAIANSAVATALNSKADSSALSDYPTTAMMNIALAGKQDTLTAGANITITNNVISATGGSQITVDTEITENSQNPVTSAAIYQMVGNVEEALRQINGTAS